MYHEFFSSKGIVQFPIVAMILFIVTFAAIVFSALRRKDPDQDSVAQLPLSEGTDADDDMSRRVIYE